MSTPEELARENARLREQLEAVTEIGIALSAERDLNSLLGTILSRARWLTHADAGSLYLVEGEDRSRLRFVLAQNDSLEVPFAEMVLDVASKTIVGHVARTRGVLNIEDVYELPDGVEYAFSTRFDESIGYRSKSMLVVPMIDHRDHLIGCLQLINRKPDRAVRLDRPERAEEVVVPFPEEVVGLAESMASQSAVAIDKARLIDDLEQTFEGLVHASVVAIESRDPTTSGHSERVAKLSVALAKAVSDTGAGKFAGVAFTADQLKELRYASLLHDFGKVGVREHVLVKAKKLYPWDLESVKLRFACALAQREADGRRRLLDELAGGAPVDRARVEEGEAELEAERARLLGLLDAVLQTNEPRVLAEGAEAQLHHVGEERFLDARGQSWPLLTAAEARDLAIPRGSLNREQRLEIESHVAHTYRFLSRIPWGEGLRDLPGIAGAHHEKLDGSGYPNGLVDAEIPPQAKIMTVADIFDALTAWDRPYKKAVPLERALDILGAEVANGKIEPQLVELFRERKLYALVLPVSDEGPPIGGI